MLFLLRLYEAATGKCFEIANQVLYRLGAKTENPLLFCVPEVMKLTLRLFFEGIDLSDFCSFALVLLWISSTNE